MSCEKLTTDNSQPTTQMSQVLARKYRPKSFADFIGQEHIVKSLTNALNNQRLHHAYLFTGTRGVGKTTLGRIIAKCLNCEAGISATPCEKCVSCQEITANCSVDLIEIDAASNTKVEDTRELLNNVQYAPTRDRFKIYLIDEVHMLSGHSFNALLKTLEEPPEHVKFILATTDPQKLPVTVLSRCLQFHLKNMPAELIAKQLGFVCEQENVPAEMAALTQLAQAANGSMRDGLSLLDQAIAYGNQTVRTQAVQAMLGILPDEQLFTLINALAESNGQQLIQQLRTMISDGADCEAILEALLNTLQQIALVQTVADTLDVQTTNATLLKKFAAELSKEQVQLFYQIALIGRRDLQWAATPQSGLEMILLRMLAFENVDVGAARERPASSLRTATPTQDNSSTPPMSKNQSFTAQQPTTHNPQPTTHNSQPTTHNSQPTTHNSQPTTNAWHQLIEALNLSGITLVLAQHCELKNLENDKITLQIAASHTALANDKQKQRLTEALNQHFGKPMRLEIVSSDNKVNSPAVEQQRQLQAEQASAKSSLENDPNIQKMMRQFGATIDTNSIRGN